MRYMYVLRQWHEQKWSLREITSLVMSMQSNFIYVEIIREFKKTTTGTGTSLKVPITPKTSWNLCMELESIAKIFAAFFLIPCKDFTKRKKIFGVIGTLTKGVMSRTKAVHVRYSVLVHFLTVLSKTTTWNDQILRCHESMNHDV